MTKDSTTRVIHVVHILFIGSDVGTAEEEQVEVLSPSREKEIYRWTQCRKMTLGSNNAVQ